MWGGYNSFSYPPGTGMYVFLNRNSLCLRVRGIKDFGCNITLRVKDFMSNVPFGSRYIKGMGTMIFHPMDPIGELWRVGYV